VRKVPIDDQQMTRRRHRAVLLVATVVMGGALLAACAGGTSSVSGPSTTSPRDATTTTPATGGGSSATKAPIAGLIDMGVQSSYLHGQPFPTVDTAAVTPYAGAFGGIVVNETWAQLEPTPGHEDYQDLNASLAAVTTWNTQHPKTPLGVKLRIFGGYTAPPWAKSLGGPPITVTAPKLGTRTYGRWWTAPYETAWSSFQHALAAQFDGNLLVREVSVSSCATSTGEPFIVSPSTIPVAEAAGWTVAAQQACLTSALHDYSGWVHTPVTFAFNPFETVVNGKVGQDQAFTTQVMQQCATSRSHGGPTCILGNNDVSPIAPSGKHVASVYAEIDTLWQQTPGHVGVYFQTAGPAVSCPTIAVAITYHASSVEVWPPNHYPGFNAESPATLLGWSSAIRTGSPLSCRS